MFTFTLFRFRSLFFFFFFFSRRCFFASDICPPASDAYAAIYAVMLPPMSFFATLPRVCHSAEHHAAAVTLMPLFRATSALLPMMICCRWRRYYCHAYIDAADAYCVLMLYMPPACLIRIRATFSRCHGHARCQLTP